MPSLARAERRTLDRWLPWALGALLALLVWAPVLGRGYVLGYDMVFVPHPALDLRGLGVDGGVPRAVPADFLVAVLSRVVPAWVLQQALLVGVVVGACVGAWRVSPARTLPATAAAAVLYAWNPFVVERLAMGHWSLLVGYAVLPWLLLAVTRVDTDGPWRVVLLAAVAAAAAPTAGLLAAAVAVVAALLVPQPTRSRVVLAAGALVVNLPWLLAGWVSAGVLSPDRTGTDVFAARADTPLGGLVSLLTFGGIWNSSVWPASRASSIAGLALLVVAGVGACGLALALRRRSRVAQVVLVVAALGLALSVPTLYAGGRDVFASLTGHVPALGILRDSQKWLAWWALAASYGIGPGLEWLVARLETWNRVWVPLAAAVVVLGSLPDLAWGVDGQLRAVSWPGEYGQVAAAVDHDPGSGAVLVLPFRDFRAWGWNHDRTVLDPWTRLVSRRVVVNDDLETTGGVVPGEDPLAADVRRVPVAGGAYPAAALRALGIGFVVVDRATARAPGDATRVSGPGVSVVHDGPLVTAWDLNPGVAAADERGHGWLLLVDAGVVALLIAAGWMSFRRRAGGRSLIPFRRAPRGSRTPR